MAEPVTPPPTIATSTTVTGSTWPAAIHGRTDGHAPRRAPLARSAGPGPAVNQATRPEGLELRLSGTVQQLTGHDVRQERREGDAAVRHDDVVAVHAGHGAHRRQSISRDWPHPNPGRLGRDVSDTRQHARHAPGH